MVTDKLGDVFGSVLTRTELSEALTEICKMDPNFEKEQLTSKEIKVHIHLLRRKPIHVLC